MLCSICFYDPEFFSEQYEMCKNSVWCSVSYVSFPLQGGGGRIATVLVLEMQTPL